jgi:NADPH:quinone reductase-like Zn-dependent oxidoreductase
MGQLEERVWPKIATGEIQAIIDTVYDIKDINKAHDQVASDTTLGKVVLAVIAA